MSAEIHVRVSSSANGSVYTVSAAARLAGMHPQTLRQWDRLGLVTPSRTSGRGRRYSADNLADLREVQRLSSEEGVNLAGIRQILELRAENRALRAELERLRAAQGQSPRVFAVAPSGQAEVVARGRRPRPDAAGRAVILWRG